MFYDRTTPFLLDDKSEKRHNKRTNETSAAAEVQEDSVRGPIGHFAGHGLDQLFGSHMSGNHTTTKTGREIFYLATELFMPGLAEPLCGMVDSQAEPSIMALAASVLRKYGFESKSKVVSVHVDIHRSSLGAYIASEGYVTAALADQFCMNITDHEHKTPIAD